MTDTPITAADNPLIKQLVRLHDGRHRREERRFIAEGRRTIQAFLDAGWTAEQLLIRVGEELPPGWPQARVRLVGERVAAKVSQTTTPSGYLAVFAIPTAPPLALAAGGLVLAQIADPGNLGTLIRSAAAFAVPQIVLLGGADPYAYKAVQASAGALARMAITQLPEHTGPEVLAGGAALCALVVSGGSSPGQLPPRARWLVVGSEAHGLRADWRAGCSERLTLPMPGRVESLNAAIAGSIACYLLSQPGAGPPPAVG